MDLRWNIANIIVLVASLMSFIQANPISTKSKNGDLKDADFDSYIPKWNEDTTPGNVNPAPNKRGNHGNVVNEDSADNNIQEDSNDGVVEAPKVMEAALPIQESSPLLGTLPLLSSLNGEERSTRTDEITKAFARKVLKAFFEELKKRPDLVNEILKRETYRMLMNSVPDESYFNPFPTGDDLNEEFLSVPSIQSQPSDNEGVVKSDDGGGANQVSKKNSEGAENENSKATVKESLGGSKVKDSATSMNASPAKTQDGTESPVSEEKSDAADAIEESIAPELLIDPYYYYVYYDESEDEESDKPGKAKDLLSTSTPEDDTSNQDSSKDGEGEAHVISNKAPRPGTSDAADKTNDDVIIDKIASAVRSVIARDMEKRIAESKLSIAKEDQQSGQGAGVRSGEQAKINPQVVRNSENKISPSKEEMQLAKLVE